MDVIRGQALAVPPGGWLGVATIVMLVTLAVLVADAARRPPFPKAAPPLVGRGGLPVLGMLRFFSERHSFMVQQIRSSKIGSFSFYFGKLPIVALSGAEGRHTFFESRDLNMAKGYTTLFATVPPIHGQDDVEDATISFNRWFNRTIVPMLRKENFVRNLPGLVGDCHAHLAPMVTPMGTSHSRTFDPFDDINDIVYKLTIRTVGAEEIAQSPALLHRSRALFETIGASSSPARIIFPWLPTLAYMRRVTAGFRLYMIFKRIVDDREKTGKRRDDPLQFLLDSGASTEKAMMFVMNAVFAGVVNSGINAAWMLMYLACDPYWYGQLQASVDDVVSRHRTSPSQSSTEVLASLSVDDWEEQFPLVDFCLRECIRMQLLGTAFRQNIGNRDVPIGKSGKVIPRGAFAVYLVDDVHMNPDIYPDPQRWDPGRYLPERAEDKKSPLSYVGWGAGRHPCLGMRFAKLEMGIIAATFISMFDFELVDRAGQKLTTVPPVDRNNFSASKPASQAFIRCWPRGR